MPPGDADRLLIADVLESVDPARAEFIRLQIEIENTPRRLLNKSYLKIQSDLVLHHGARWAGPLAGQVLDYHFSKGFLHRVLCRPVSMLAHGELWLQRHPIRDVTLVREVLQLQSGVQALAQAPLNNSDLTVEFFDHPLLHGAECLDLGDFPLSDQQWSQFFGNSSPPKVQTLVVSQMTRVLAQLLTRNLIWQRLSRLRVSGEADLEAVQLLCRAVAASKGQGPRILLKPLRLPAVQEMIQKSDWASRFSFRE